MIAAQLALGLWVMALFEIEPLKRIEGLHAAWIALTPSVLFLAHSLVPLAWRKPLLLAATFGLMVLLLGITATAYVLGSGLLLLGICHLPIAFWQRVLALIVTATILAVLQAQLVETSRILRIALAMLGAIFMFRLIIYLYDLRHAEPAGVSVVDRISYFFLLPVPLFPFFPTLDYKVYLRCYYDRPSYEIYQTGVLWFSRGIVHLVLYRIVYHFYSPAPELVVDAGGVMAFCLSGYLIYLRVSGTFHIIGGLLRLFGYDLPETHRLYFFATGFSDYWRRINIYWKDFMAKLFFFPTIAAFGRRKLLNNTWRVIIATVIVFIATTVLHSYQTFWLRGQFTIHETDYWFWGILGVLVIINNLIPQKKKSLSREAAAWQFKKALITSLKATGMFVFLCLLWALWSSNTLEAFFDMLSGLKVIHPAHVLTFLGFCGLAVGLGTLGQYFAYRGFHVFEERPTAGRSILTTCLPLLLLSGLYLYSEKRGFNKSLDAKFSLITSDQLNVRDQMAKERSYYEGLFAGGPSIKIGVDDEERVKTPVDDLRGYLYHKSFGPTQAWGARWSSNRWRMRDKDYSKEKPEGVTRIALGGASYVMGRGVGDGENFESRVEAHLNDQGAQVEILNFAVAGNSTIQRIADLEMRIADFDPDYFFLVCHRNEVERTLREIADVIRAQASNLYYPLLEEIVAKEEISHRASNTQIVRALAPYSHEIMTFAYKRLAEFCEERGIIPVWIYLPMPNSAHREEFADEGRNYAEAAGIQTIELHGAYGDWEAGSITLSDADSHPNRIGHRLIASRLLDELKSKRTALGLPESIDSVPRLRTPEAPK